MTVPPMLLPFKEALLIGVLRGQRLRCGLSSVQRVRNHDLATSGAWPRFRYVNNVTEEVVESSRADLLVERWMSDLDQVAQMDQRLRRVLESVVREERREDSDGD